MSGSHPRRLSRSAFAATVLALLLVGIAARFQRPGASGQLVEREFRTAILARSFSFDMRSDIPQWRQDVVAVSRSREGALEPPITEYLIAVGFRLSGGEHWWVGRALTSCFWFIGALFLYRLARVVASPEAALFPVAFYLLNPLAVSLSRSLQPDALMMLAFLVALTAIWTYCEKPNRQRLIVAALLAGVAILVKPHIVFFLLGAALAVVTQQSVGRTTGFRRMLVFTILAVAPSAIYFGWTAFTASDWDAGMLLTSDDRPVSMVKYAALRMLDLELLSRPSFWRDWLVLANAAVGYAALSAALIGLALLPSGAFRSMLIGMWVAYPVFCVAFSGRIADHGYYHAVLIPIVALSMAVVAESIWGRMRAAPLSRSLPVAVALAIGLGLGLLRTRQLLRPADVEDADVLREVGRTVRHSTRTVYIAKHYGRAMEYWGELSGIPWPGANDMYGVPPRSRGHRSLEERLSALTAPAEYFIITDFQRFDRYHQDLKSYLAESCRELARTDDYIIYNQCTPVSISVTIPAQRHQS
jgi:hypothetical protein